MKAKSKDEFQTMYHMMFVAVISIFLLLMMAVGTIYQWIYWKMLCVVCGAVILSCWLVHLLQIGTARKRLYYYAAVVMCGLLFYGSSSVALTDVPILICLFIIILSVQREMRLIYMMVATYPILLLWHIFVTGFINSDMDLLLILRMVLNILSIGCAIMISAFFFRQQDVEKQRRGQLETDLQRAKKENEKLLVNVSHELRTPINAVNGMSEIILHKELESELRGEVESIQSAGRRLYGQVSDILDYSELITGSMVVSEEDYEPVSVINDAIHGVQWERMNRKMDVALDIQPDIPKVLRGDAGKVKKIIQALLDNAVKFTETGGAYLYVSVREEEYGCNLNIDVKDTGIGMNDEQLERIFTSFYKEDSDVERKTGGLGLGLAIVHGMVAAMGGFVSIESKPSYGTHVSLSIPQGIVNRQPSISVNRNEEFHIACYFNMEKYARTETAEYYSSMIRHFQTGLGLSIRQAQSLDELKTMVAEHAVTHVFVADWEYGMDKDYFEDMGKKVFTVVFADDSFSLPEGSAVHVLRKPVYLLGVVNLLNATMPGTFREKIVQTDEEQLTFTDVKALVVDDDYMNLMVAKGILKSYGIAADTSLSGEKAIERCSFTDYQIIFMDHMMPGMNGVEAMHKIREQRNGHYKSIPIVALTANAVSGAREMFLGEGFDEFISKPIELTSMTRLLRKMLKGESANE
jgi:signal transduction histidine kinase/CheY-like chemotaxis protein